ncbi:unnamed protein product [Clonostachys rosea]|uniref:Ornithine cyclodeaminase n=1 Tax=Bionectria ochroleuca TaxID=29856 RepID=A0ABY6V1I4_BIOOC|nr:unnamed protein product [Clonostachys rosea]
MTFTVLSDDNVKEIFRDLTLDNVHSLADALERALLDYSCANEQQYQPARSVVSRPSTGQVSLFMPATTPEFLGVKIVGIAPSKTPSTAPANNGKPPLPALQSALTICDELGRAIGILNAAELTAFRTSLGSMLLYRWRKQTENILVFGAGAQAVWHVRLAILLKGKDIRNITVVNRSSDRIYKLIESLKATGSLPEHITITAVETKDAQGDALEELVTAADAIFCTTPSTQPLWPASYLTSEKARQKTRFISAIGSYRLDMAEIDPELLKAVVDPAGPFASQVLNGQITVDSREGCNDEAGELVSAGIQHDQMLEAGMVRDQKNKGSSSELDRWLESGFVIYKSVGIGIMDIAIGKALMDLAKAKNIGFYAPSF